MRQQRGSSTAGAIGGSVAVLALTVALTACGGGGSSVQSKATTTTTTTLPAASTTPTTTGGVTSATRCHTAQLSASFGAVGAGAGNRYVRVILTNHGPSSCSTIGYVGLALLGPGGQPIPTNVVRDGPGTVATVVLAPGAQASALLHWGAIPAGNEPQTGSCETPPQQVQVTPPNETLPLTVGWSFGPVCEQGRIDAGPLQAGVPAQ